MSKGNAGIQLKLCLPPCSQADDEVKLTFSRSSEVSILHWFFPKWAQAGLLYPGAKYTVGFLLPSMPTLMEPRIIMSHKLLFQVNPQVGTKAKEGMTHCQRPAWGICKMADVK